MRTEFPSSVKRAAWERATGTDGIARCEECTARLGAANVYYDQRTDGEFDHNLPDWLGGLPVMENCVVRCRTCHKRKTHIDVKMIAKAKRLRDRDRNINRRPSQPMPCGRNSQWKFPMRGWHAERRL